MQNSDHEDGDSVKLVLSSDEGNGDGPISPARHLASTIALCLCTLTHSWLLINVFPYSGYMAIALVSTANQENAGSYAGLLASSFMLGRALSSYGWGQLADTYGRIFVLQSSLALSCVFTLLFGVSRTFVLAMLWRFLLGFGNGIIGTAKTAVSELAKGNERLETRGMGLVMGMWGWGFLICPALSGALAEPVRQYPGIPIVQQGWINSVLTQFPFLLPNMVGAIFCMAAMIGVSLFVEETLDSSQRRSARFLVTDFLTWIRGISRQCSKWLRPSRSRGEKAPLKRKGDYQVVNDGMYGNNNGSSRTNVVRNQNNDRSPQLTCMEFSELAADEEDADEALKESTLKHSESSSMLCLSPRRTLRKSLVKRCPSIKALRRWSEASSATTDEHLTAASEGGWMSTASPTLSELWSNRIMRNHLLVYWIYSFVSIQVDEAFPLFCISQSGGLGLSEDNIGKILSGSGIIFAVFQYFAYVTIVNRCGLYPSMHISSFLGAPIIALIPLSAWLFHPSDTTTDYKQGASSFSDNTLSWSAFIFLSVVMASYRIFANIFFSSITVATNRTVPAAQRGTMNGLSMLGGSVSKACGPAFAGFLVAFCLSSGMVPHRVGGALIFAVISLLGIAVAMAGAFLLHEIKDDDVG